MWNLKRNYKNELNKKRPPDLENKLMVAGAKDQGKRKLGSLAWTCTHYYV